jgi:lysozyme
MKRIIIFITGVFIFTTAMAQSQYVECEDTCSHIHGIDLSRYQGTVFWETVGKTKMAYVYLKATEGGDHIDVLYKQNIDLAHQYGLKVGSYHFYRPKTPQQTQLENFMTQCRPDDQDLIPMIDVETTSGLSIDAFRDSLFKFLDLVEMAYKQKPLIYTGANFYDKNLLGSLKNYKVMIAQYTERVPVLKDDLDFILWQYTGKGRLNGINGYVDKSRFMGDHVLREIRFRHKQNIEDKET